MERSGSQSLRGHKSQTALLTHSSTANLSNIHRRFEIHLILGQENGTKDKRFVYKGNKNAYWAYAENIGQKA